MSSIVLCSGGLDSTTLATQCAASGEDVSLCFVDYGQAPRHRERDSVAQVAKRLNVEARCLRVDGLAVPEGGEIPGRNMLLVSVALAAHPDVGSMYLGIHAGTGYVDCSPSFVDATQRLLDLHTGGRGRLVAPFISWSKADVLALARDLGVAVETTYSCESGDEPCGRCSSCIDREVLLGC